MGILRDSLKSALGGNGPQNGLGGRSRGSATYDNAFQSNIRYQDSWDYSRPPKQPPQQAFYGDNRQGYSPQRGPRTIHLDPSDPRGAGPPHHRQYDSNTGDDYLYSDTTNNTYDAHGHRPPPDYYADSLTVPSHHRSRARTLSPASRENMSPRTDPGYEHNRVAEEEALLNTVPVPNTRSPRRGAFRPFVLPQIQYGAGQPFVRAYGICLARRGVSEADFIAIVDKLNIAEIPNPENQLFQKGANIAGWFVPGAAGIGLMAGQVVTGLGAAYGKMSMTGKVLRQANMDVFLPNGLEICIATTQNIDQELGVCTDPYACQQMSFASPEQRISYYGDLVSPILRVYQVSNQGGRKDPIAMLGKGMNARDTQRSLQKAQKDAMRGKGKKVNKLESNLKWIMVKEASPEALACLRNNSS